MNDQEFNDMVQEEAAEMFRDVLDDKLPMTGKRTLLNRIIEFTDLYSSTSGQWHLCGADIRRCSIWQDRQEKQTEGR